MAASKRKTKNEIFEDRAKKDRIEWHAFSQALAACTSMVDVLLLMKQSPAPDSPGRKYYSNLSVDIQNFIVPAGSTSQELALYLQLIQRMEPASFVSGAKEQTEIKLKNAMLEREPGNLVRQMRDTKK